MNMDPNDPAFANIISFNNVKQVFEQTAFFYELYMEQKYIFTGFWSGDTWHYNDATVEQHFQSFTEGFINGVVELYIREADEQHQAERRMKAQINETAGTDEIVLDISPYLK
jgi:hypothetical protein